MRNQLRPRDSAISVPDKVILELNPQKETFSHNEVAGFTSFTQL